MKKEGEIEFYVYPELELEAEEILRGGYDIPLKEAPKTVLDIGANTGLFSLWATRKWPEAKITAFEPWPESVLHFRSNMRDFPNVLLSPFGVRRANGDAKIREGKNRGMCNFIDNEGRSFNVFCVAASAIPSAEFVKIDTEGCEMEILEGLNLSATKAIAVEAHGREDASRITGLLTGKGFALHSSTLSADACWVMKFVRRDSLVHAQKLFVAVPIYGNAPTAFFECLVRLSKSPPCHLVIRHCVGDSLVCRARNTLTAEFLDSDCTDLLFIDSDLIFSTDHVRRIASHDVDVVAGFYPKKQEGPLEWVCNVTQPVSDIRPDGLQPMRYMGTGFMRVRRSVFEDMEEDGYWYSPDSSPWRVEHNFWPVGAYEFPDKTRRYLSEDWFFCQRWLDRGGTVYGDTRIILKHIGQATYPLQTQVSDIITPG